jgi:hypothetical protein
MEGCRAFGQFTSQFDVPARPRHVPPAERAQVRDPAIAPQNPTSSSTLLD